MKRSIKTLSIVLVLLVAGTTCLSAQFGLGRGRYYSRVPVFTEEQRTQMNSMADDHWEKMDELRTDFQQSTDIEKRGELAKEMQILRDTYSENIRDLLTNEQKEAVDSSGYLLPYRRGIGRATMPRNFRNMRPRNRFGYDNIDRIRPGGRGFGYGYRFGGGF